ncbi:hypothetical protein GCM10027446_04670 [Angustibacter peucedani]
MVTPEYARAYIDEITRLAPRPQGSDSRASLARLLRKLSR